MPLPKRLPSYPQTLVVAHKLPSGSLYSEAVMGCQLFLLLAFIAISTICCVTAGDCPA